MNIRKAVLKAINEKVKTAQVNCDVEVELLRQDRKESTTKVWRNLWIELGRIGAMFKTRKAEIEARHVNSILSKVL